MKILFIGGTGVISSACSKLAIERGLNLYLLNRGLSPRATPPGVHVIQADMRQPEIVKNLIADYHFDVVVDWIAYTPEQVETDLALFQGQIGQYIFISSASAYRKPPTILPITESTILDNPFWAYSRAKIACEERLIQAYREIHFPVTIVRPSHTYDRTRFPFHGGYTNIQRLRRGKKVIIHGDGTSLWVLTHHDDFAKAFLGLLGNQRAIGEAFHITSDEVLTWNQIYECFARKMAVAAHFVHIPSELIAAYDPDWGVSLLGDKAHSVIFDNRKIKKFVPDFNANIPFCRGVEEILNWHEADPARQLVDKKVDRLMDEIITAYEMGWPKKKS
ncbi:SDR family oxidoreductase [candidate division KSB1 bacterium]|nr:SDR family oxidoreductase [candidate division KSB1 bacterium]